MLGSWTTSVRRAGDWPRVTKERAAAATRDKLQGAPHPRDSHQRPGCTCRGERQAQCGWQLSRAPGMPGGQSGADGQEADTGSVTRGLVRRRRRCPRRRQATCS